MSATYRISFAVAAMGAVLLLGRPAAGQTPEDKAAAQVAFDKALALLEQGDTDQACPLLEDSLRLDPAMGTQYQLGQCYEKAGQLASAWASYTAVADAAKAAGMSEREQWARERVDALAPRLSKLTIVVPDAVGGLPGLAIERDGRAVPRTLWGEAIPIDGGAHHIVATATGRAPWTGDVSVAPEKDAARLELPMLQAEGDGGGAPPGEATPAATQDPDDGGVSGDDGSAQTIAGITVAALGVAAMGAGVVVGIVAKGDYDDSGEEHCTDGFCDQAGIDGADDARALGNVATGLFIGGGAALVAGVVTWLTAPSGSEPSVEETSSAAMRPRIDIVVGPGQAGLGLRARW